MSVSTAGAIRSALDHALTTDPRVMLLGESVGRLGGVHRTSQGLQERHGEERVVDLPLSEAGAVGLAIGLALAGKRPVLELPAGAALPAREQIEGELARIAVDEDDFSLPVTLRIAHEAVGSLPLASAEDLALVEGLTVLVPSSPQDAAGMLLYGALHAQGPTVLLEWEYSAREDVTLTPSTLEARVVRQGSGCTVLAWGAAVAAALELPGVEVVDLRCLAPLALDTIAASVARTGRVVVAGSGPLAESVLHRAAQAAFLHLESPPALASVDDLASTVRATITF